MSKRAIIILCIIGAIIVGSAVGIIIAIKIEKNEMKNELVINEVGDSKDSIQTSLKREEKVLPRS